MSKSPQTVAVFPGAFDPLTHGHLDIAHRCRRVFGRLIVAVGVNPEKPAWFTAQERVEMIREALAGCPDVTVEAYDGLTMDYVRSVGANVVVRGIRDTVDLREEIRIANVNRMVGGIETVFLMTDDRHALTASSLIKQIVHMGGFDEQRIAHLVPPAVIEPLREKLQSGVNRPTDPNVD